MKNKPLVISGLVLLLLIFVAVILSPLYKQAPRRMKPVFKGRIAIVIDDWGYHLDNLPIAGQIKQPLTCAVLPGLKNSREVSQRLHKLGFEIILHLPMEPKGKLRLEKDTIAVNMGREQMRRILDKDLTSVIFAKGVSNHMGSRVTEDINSSAMIMLEIKKHNLYFLDSFVTAKSVCAPLAGKMGLRFARRDVFLDNRDEPEYIREQVKILKNLTQTRGVAVGIGHDRRATLLVLKEMLPQLAKEGYKFVFVSEIARVER
ncbi:divergent polysaccharide deacetylase family protein [bacterium]|nr:MAG: divergent polysaccharide deacetylase family protein [bacterium]